MTPICNYKGIDKAQLRANMKYFLEITLDSNHKSFPKSWFE